MRDVKFQLPESWQNILISDLNTDSTHNLIHFLQKEKDKCKVIYPLEKDIFSAFAYTPYNDVKVVILGQDPYHGEGQAHGLSFSVPKDVRIPPSLRNIYKEIHADLGCNIPQHGCLESWAKQGVLLLNSVLTVEANKPASHANKGWELFTDIIIQKLNEQEKPIVFMLWGSYAQKKGAFINKNKHLVLEAVHPSPLSAHRGFLGCKHFSKANAFLKEKGRTPIDWPIKDDSTQLSLI